MLSELAYPHIRCCLSAIPSDLMKSTAVDESLSSMNQQFCSRENQLLQMLQQNEKSTQILRVIQKRNSAIIKKDASRLKIDASGLGIGAGLWEIRDSMNCNKIKLWKTQYCNLYQQYTIHVGQRYSNIECWVIGRIQSLLLHKRSLCNNRW